MIGLDFAKSSEYWFGGWSPARLMLTIAVSLFVIFALDAASPRGAWVSEFGAPNDGGDQNFASRWRIREDPRSFTTPQEVGHSRDAFGLAWIGGSSITVVASEPDKFFRGRAKYNLTDVFAATTRAINDRPLCVHEYTMSGVGNADMRRAALHAAEDPLIDLVVVALNPAWLFNEFSMFAKSNQKASVVAMPGAEIEDFLLALGYARPSALAGARIATAMNVVNARFALNNRLFPTDSSTTKFPLPYAQNVLAMKYPPSAYEFRFPRRNYLAPPATKSVASNRVTILRQRLDPSSVNARFFRLMLRSLAASDKPVLLYIAPMPVAVEEDRVLREFMDEWIVLVNAMVREAGGSNIVFRKEVTLRDGLAHKDIIHLRYGQGVVDAVSGYLREDFGMELDQTPAVSIYGSGDDPARFF